MPQAELGSSPDNQETTDVNTAESSTTEQQQSDVNTPESSTGEQGVNKPATVLEAVKAALAEQGDESQAGKSPDAEKGSEPEGAAGEEEQADDEDGSAESDEELLKSLDPKGKANKRIRELIDENRELKARSVEADNFRQLSEWTRQSGLDQQDFITGLQIMREMKNDPHKAWEMLQPYVASLQQSVGIILPDDIQERLDAGLVDQETARELAQARSRSNHLAQQRQAAEERQQIELEHNESTQLRVAVAQAVTDWENAWKAKDPDYGKKKAMVKATVIQMIHEEGVPNSPQAAVEQAKRARKAVEDQLASIMPRRSQIATPPTGGGSANATPAPRSSLDAARSALNGNGISSV